MHARMGLEGVTGKAHTITCAPCDDNMIRLYDVNFQGRIPSRGASRSGSCIEKCSSKGSPCPSASFENITNYEIDLVDLPKWYL